MLLYHRLHGQDGALREAFFLSAIELHENQFNSLCYRYNGIFYSSTVTTRLKMELSFDKSVVRQMCHMTQEQLRRVGVKSIVE